MTPEEADRMLHALLTRQARILRLEAALRRESILRNRTEEWAARWKSAAKAMKALVAVASRLKHP